MKIKFLSWIGSLLSTLALLVPLVSSAAEQVILDQGAEWTATARKDFYSRDQEVISEKEEFYPRYSSFGRKFYWFIRIFYE